MPGVAQEALVKLDSGSSVGEILAVFRLAAQRHPRSGFGRGRYDGLACETARSPTMCSKGTGEWRILG
jgi:hypothetical protein